MAKKGSRLREFEKNHRVLDISSAQEARQKKKTEKKRNLDSDGAPGTADAAAGGSGGAGSSASGADRSSGGRRTRINWVRAGSLIIALVFMVVVGLSVKNIFDLREREASLMEEKERLTMIREELQMQLAHIDSDEYMEEQARRQLKLVKGNELIFYFPEDFQVDKDAEEDAAGDEEEKKG